MNKQMTIRFLISALATTQLFACASGQTPSLGTPPAPGASAAPTAAPSAAVPMPTADPTQLPSAQPTAAPELLANLTGVWSGGSSGKYYLRQSGDTVLWYGEHKANTPEWAQVAIGKRDSQNRLVMDWYDVPKGASSGQGTLEAQLMPESRLAESSHTGSLNETQWQLETAAPSYPLIDQDGPMLALPPAHDFTGGWKDLSGARFYLSQHGNKLVGYAESTPANPEWSAILYGSVSGTTVRLKWAGLPKSTQANFSFSSGVKRMTSPNENILMLADGSPGPAIGMSKWARVN